MQIMYAQVNIKCIGKRVLYNTVLPSRAEDRGDS